MGLTALQGRDAAPAPAQRVVAWQPTRPSMPARQPRPAEAAPHASLRHVVTQKPAPHDADKSWATRAACVAGDPDDLFVQGAEQNRVKSVCQGCPVRLECLADALDNRIEFGVWGGLTERERRSLLRRSPHVPSWRRVLEEARRNHVPDGLAVAG